MTATGEILPAGPTTFARSTASDCANGRLLHLSPRGAEALTTRVGLHMPSGLHFEDWERAGRTLAGIIDSSSWWLGDWLVYGKDNYSDRYETGIRAAGLKYQTLRNYAWVARRFEFGRRRVRLTFQHHAEVASLTLAEQERWLDAAEKADWTTRQLRNALRSARGNGLGGVRTDENHHLEVPVDRIRSWRDAAECAGVDFEDWVLTTLDSAALKILDELGALARQPVEAPG